MTTTGTAGAASRKREHRAEARSVHRLLHPCSVAVIGAGRQPGGVGHEILKNLREGGFRGDLVAVNPAALTTNLADLKPGGVLIVDSGAFSARNLKKAGYEHNPLEDESLRAGWVRPRGPLAPGAAKVAPPCP